MLRALLRRLRHRHCRTEWVYTQASRGDGGDMEGYYEIGFMWGGSQVRTERLRPDPATIRARAAAALRRVHATHRAEWCLVYADERNDLRYGPDRAGPVRFVVARGSIKCAVDE